MSSITSAIGGKHTCELCGYQTLKKTHLRLHKQAVHDGGELQCPGCDHQFCSKGALANHHKSINLGQIFQYLECEHQATQTSSNLYIWAGSVSVIIRQLRKVTLPLIRNPFIWAVNSNAQSVNIKQVIKLTLLCIINL